MNIGKIVISFFILSPIFVYGSLMHYGGRLKNIKRLTTRTTTAKKRVPLSKKVSASKKKFVRFYSTENRPMQNQEPKQGIFNQLYDWVYKKFRPRREIIYQQHQEVFQELEKQFPHATQGEKNKIREVHKKIFDMMITAQNNDEVVLVNNMSTAERICFSLVKLKVNQDGDEYQKQVINSPFAILTWQLFIDPFYKAKDLNDLANWHNVLFYKHKTQDITGPINGLFDHNIRPRDYDLMYHTSIYLLGLKDRHKTPYEEKIVKELEDIIKKYCFYKQNELTNYEIIALTLKKNNPLFKEYPWLKESKHSTLIYDANKSHFYNKNKSVFTSAKVFRQSFFKDSERLEPTSELFMSDMYPVDRTKMQTIEEEIEKIIREFNQHQERYAREEREEQEYQQKREKRSTTTTTRQEALKTLKLPENATSDEIRKAFLTLAKKNHPDQFRDEKSKKEAAERFIKIKDAYDFLIGK